jgi:FMN phosphatase YigB (HAD superfamily)
MIKALLLDLGGTLIDSSEQVFPGVQDALTVLEAFETADHQPLVTCLVSDFTMPEPRTTEATRGGISDYLKISGQNRLAFVFRACRRA